MNFPTTLIVIIGAIALLAIGLIIFNSEYANAPDTIDTSLMVPLYTATPTQIPTTAIIIPVDMVVQPPTKITFTVMKTEESDHSILTTDYKTVTISDLGGWGYMMPNKIYTCEIAKQTGISAYAVNTCSLYSYQNPSYVRYPVTPTQNYYVYSGIMQYYHFNNQYVECAIGHCEPFNPSQIPPSEHTIEQFPPNTILS